MPKFEGRVEIWAKIIVEGDDMYHANEVATNMSREELLALIDFDWAEIEVFPDEFPEQLSR